MEKKIDMLEKYKSVAFKYEKEMMKRDDVIGVMQLGGIARNRADQYSDIDIAIFSHKPLKDITLGESWVEPGCDLEVFNIAIDDGYEDWGEIKREAYQEGYISSDKTGEVKAFMEKALYYDDQTFAYNALDMIFAMAWHGYIYTPFRKKVVHGYYWVLPHNLWHMRGEVNNSYYLLRYSAECFMHLLFVVNRRWAPDYKWRYLKSKNLKRLPNDYVKKIDYIFFEADNETTFKLKVQYLNEMLDEIVEEIEPLLPENWYEVIEG